MSKVEDPEAFADVMDKIRIIADNEYEGEILGSSSKIFMQLTHEERELLLRSLLQIYFIFNRSMPEFKVEVEEGKEKKPKETCSSIQGEIEDIDSANEYELIKLKSWLVKWFVAVGTLSILGFFAFLSYTGQKGDTNIWKSNLSTLWEVVKVLFNL